MATDEQTPAEARRQRRWGDSPRPEGRWRSQRGATERRRAVGCLMAGAMVAAPFIALLYGINAGLAVMGAALLATAYATLSAARHAEVANRQSLRLLAAANAILALLCFAALVLRVR